MSTLFTWQHLHNAGFDFKGDFLLPLSDGTQLLAKQVLRILPKKRMVVSGVWEDKKVVAKLFYDKNALAHADKDAAGVKILVKGRIPTPALLYQGSAQDKRIQILLFQQILEAKSLDDILHEQGTSSLCMLFLQRVTMELAIQHALGVLQEDLHPKNFLLTAEQVYTLDGGQVQAFSLPLSKEQSLQKLALFFSQWGVGLEEEKKTLFHLYAKSRGWIVGKKDLKSLFSQIKYWQRVRWQRYQDKIFRQSSDFSPIKSRSGNGMYNRHFSSQALQIFLQDPEALFRQGNIQILKQGRSSTVVRAQMGNQVVVVKRYNIKSGWHWLRRCFRETRAAFCWRLSQKLDFFGISTARPIAFFEKKFLCFRGTSYFVMEYISGERADAFFRDTAEESVVTQVIENMVGLLKNLCRLRIAHGDLKITNILLNEKLSPVLIDLDGVIEYVSAPVFHKVWRKEIKRFLENFHTMPVLYEQFKKLLLRE